jgi:transposase
MSGPMTKVFVADARRRWSEEEKQAIIEESKTNPVARVAKKHGVAASLLFRWRKMQGIGARRPRPSKETDFVPIALPAPASGLPLAAAQGVIEIVLGGGRRVIVGGDVDTCALKRVIAALETK